MNDCGAADGTPPQSVLDCLYSHIPRHLDVIILEFGSMARDVSYPSVEALLRGMRALEAAGGRPAGPLSFEREDTHLTLIRRFDTSAKLHLNFT